MPLALTLAIKTVRAALILPFPLYIKKDYEIAARIASAAVTNQRYDDPKRPLKRITNNDWQLELDGFLVRYELIEHDILHMTASGFFQEKHIKPHFEFREKVFKAMSLKNGSYYILTDATHVKAIKAKALGHCIRREKEWQQKHPFRIYIFYGANRAIRSAIHLIRPFTSPLIRLTGDLEGALKLIYKERSREQSLLTQTLGLNASGTLNSSNKIRQYIDDLLRFIGDIDWEADGFMSRGSEIELSHPFRPVVDAIEVVKYDLDQLLREKKASADEFRKSEEKYHTILNSIEEGYYEVDRAGNFTFFNTPMCRMLGYSKEELLGMNNRQCMDKENANKTFLTFNSVYTTGTPSKAFECEFIKKDGSRLSAETSITLMRDNNHQPIGFRGIFRDLTERKIAEKKAQSLENRLHYAQRMESIGTLAAGIAHNFNNLLMGIQGNVSLMLLGADFSDQRLRQIEKMIKSGSELTGQLLGYAREGKYRVKPLNLDRLVKEVSDTFGATSREIRVHRKLASDPTEILADQAQLKQVLLNLYVNAADAMPEGGDLFIKTINISHKDIKDRAYTLEHGAYVLLTIRDTGIGMDKATMERIFEPFFSTKGLTGGTGLGLASAYGIIKNHGGYIDVTSQKGQGTTFEIFLPISQAKIMEKKDLSEKIFIGNEAILLVDDEDIVIDVGSQMLSALGYKVLTARNGLEALEVYKQNKASIDLVILDMIMPRTGGGKTYDRLKEISPDIKVLLSSGYSINGQATEILKRGCNGFIQKPFNMADLSSKIRETLGKNQEVP